MFDGKIEICRVERHLKMADVAHFGYGSAKLGSARECHVRLNAHVPELLGIPRI